MPGFWVRTNKRQVSLKRRDNSGRSMRYLDRWLSDKKFKLLVVPYVQLYLCCFLYDIHNGHQDGVARFSPLEDIIYHLTQVFSHVSPSQFPEQAAQKESEGMGGRIWRRCAHNSHLTFPKIFCSFLFQFFATHQLAITNNQTTTNIIVTTKPPGQSMLTPTSIMQTRRRVTFSDNSEMILVLNLAQTDRKHFLWFTPDELRSFKSNVHSYINVARRLISERQIPSADVIIGLEKHLSVQLTAEYRARRSKLYKVVLGEDAWHRSPDCAGVPQDEMTKRLARISVENTKWAMERALAAAMYLEEDQVTEQRLQEHQQKQTTQQDKDLSHSVPCQEQSWQTNRRSSLQEMKRCRIVDTPASPLEGKASYPRLLRTVSPSNSTC